MATSVYALYHHKDEMKAIVRWIGMIWMTDARRIQSKPESGPKLSSV